MARAVAVTLPFLFILVAAIAEQSRALTVPPQLYDFPQAIIAYNNEPLVSPSASPPFSSLRSVSPSPYSISPFPASAPLVPAFFVIGDSAVDCGTNNYLGTFARADRPPYGRDFDTGRPTGRFCNGRIPVDFLALRLGLPFVPSYLGQKGTLADMIHGVNYASAGAGIIFSSGSELGQRISLTHQVQQFTDSLQTFILSIGEQATAELVSSSVLYISIGINDYIHYYLPNISNNLYDMNVRKMVIMGMPPIGCAPHYLWKYGSKNGECVEEINNMITEFNFLMRYIVDQLQYELPQAQIIFCDVYEGSMDIIQNHANYGFTETTDACCGLGKYKGWVMCIAPEMACSNASNHIWWDQYHPTAAVNSILADNVWNGLHSQMCYPMNLEDMISARPK
ncbi:unnamed protein product [Linum tenue]|uniref:Uncharacterized protein n=1 Tax=Linum tenue TaxID=586396 RepID=A0AAV0JIC3_9ROSI|nr:unnamed protein product [Linum tenue]